MRAIKQVLTERYYSWEEARKIARNDVEVDLSGDGAAYTPSHFEEDILEEQALEQEIEEAKLPDHLEAKSREVPHEPRSDSSIPAAR